MQIINVAYRSLQYVQTIPILGSEVYSFCLFCHLSFWSLGVVEFLLLTTYFLKYETMIHSSLTFFFYTSVYVFSV